MIALTPAYLTIAFLTISLVALSFCTWRVYRIQRSEAASVARLEDVLTRMTREVVAANARVARTERTIAHMGDRQDTMECRAAGGQRIESAVRVARQGAASEAVLRDLGLSDAEASLLLRLHVQQTGQSDVAAQSREHAEASADAQIQALTSPTPPSSQAASLASLLAAADLDPAAA